LNYLIFEFYINDGSVGIIDVVGSRFYNEELGSIDGHVVFFLVTVVKNIKKIKLLLSAIIFWFFFISLRNVLHYENLDKYVNCLKTNSQSMLRF